MDFEVIWFMVSIFIIATLGWLLKEARWERDLYKKNLEDERQKK